MSIYADMWESGAGANPPVPPGGQVNSLRFSEDTLMSRDYGSPFQATTYTVSCWAKLTETQVDSAALWCAGMPFGASQTGGGLQWTTNVGDNNQNGLISYCPFTANSSEFVDGRYRDQGAWYHVVTTTEPGVGIRVYINGQLRSSFATNFPASTNGVFGVGSTANVDAPWSRWEGYLADFYFVDGQSLLPETFGRPNDQGVWVPREPDFMTGRMRPSDFLTSPVGVREATFAFDGRTDTFADSEVGGGSDTLTWDLPAAEAIDWNNDIEVFTTSGNPGDGSQLVFINGQQTAAIGSGAWTQVATGGGTLNSLAIQNTAGGPGRISGIKIDGITQLNPFQWSGELTTNGTWETAQSPSQCFDGSDLTEGTAVTVDGSNCFVEFAPSAPIDITGKTVQLFTYNQPSTITLGGANTAVIAQGIQNVNVGTATEISATSPLRITHNSPNSGTGWAQLIVGGTVIEDGVNTSYGERGFHLTFEDTNDLGHDSSGNGNDFTAEGFDIQPPSMFSNQTFTVPLDNTPAVNDDYLTTTDVNFIAGLPPVNFYTSGGSEFRPDGNAVVRFNPPINNVVSIETFTERLNRVVWVNGVAFDRGQSTDNVWEEIWNGPATDLETLFLQVDPTFLGNLKGIRVTFAGGGAPVELIDNNGTGFSPMLDGPTQNYSTFNALMPLEAALDKGNLRFQAPVSDRCATITIPFNTSNTFNWYVEFQHSLANRSAAGVASVDSNFSTGPDSRGLSNSFVYDSNGPIWINGVEQSPAQAPWNAGTVISMRYNSDTRELIFANNGVDQTGVATVLPPDTDMVITCSDLTGAAGGSVFHFNGGQIPFQFQPQGFLPFQTQSMPEVINSGDNFGVLTWQGNATAPRNITGLDFTPDMVWIKSRNAGHDHQVNDVVREAGNTLMPNLNAAQIDFDDGLSAFIDGGFTLLDDGNNARYNENGTTYVAWCWKAGGAAETINAGSIGAGVPAVNSNVSADTDAGFSIVQWTGNGSNDGQVAHGLNAKPEFILYKTTQVVNSWTAWYSVGDRNTALILDLPNTGIEITTATFGTPTAQTISNFQSGVGTEMIAYCWHSVPGYSKIGMFNGNSSADGPFVYTGFRPAWIMFKALNQNNSWQIIDTARDPFNNNTSTVLQANEEAGDNTNILDFVDIYSNGFKIKDGSGFNQNGWQISYMAFAENPQGGSNVSPANAR